MKNLRFKHYSFIVMSAILFALSVGGMLFNLKPAEAEQSQVAITSPGPNRELAQKNHTIRGTAPALKSIRVFDGTRYLGDTTSNTDGEWAIEWTKVTPGQHELNVYLADGSAYTTSPTSKNAASSVNINSGQITNNFEAGIALPEAVVYDETSGNAYTLNRVNHTVSVVSPANRTYVSTIEYATSDALEPTEYDSSSCRCQNYTYAYDEQAREIYIFDLERVYIISTQTNTLARTITVDMPADATEYPGGSLPGYGLYVDRQTGYLYLYVADTVYSEQPIQRYDISTGQKDQTWSVNGRRIVGGASGDLYYIDQTGLSQDNAQGSWLYKYDNQSSQSAQIDLSSVGCTAADWKNLAVNSDHSYVYVGCYEGTGDNFPSKQIAINTSDDSLSDVTLSANEGMEWLTQGNLVADKLALIHVDGNSFIKSLDASTNAAQPDIDVPGYGANTSEAKSTIRQTFVSDDRGYFSFITPGGVSSDEAFFSVSVVDSSNANIISRPVFKYPWTTIESETLIGANTAEFVPNFSTSNSESKPPAFIGDDLLYISELPLNRLQLLDVSLGDFSEIQNGIGPASIALSDKDANRLFTVNEASVIIDGEPLSYLSDRVVVSNLETGEYEQTVSLGFTKAVRSAYMDKAGGKLYVFATDLQEGVFDTSQIDIYRIDTQTLLIDKTYEDIEFDSSTPLDDILILDQSTAGIVGDDLVFSNADTSTVYFLNVDSGSVRTYDNTPDVENYYVKKTPLAVDSNNRKVAFLHIGPDVASSSIRIINSDNLSVSSDIAISDLGFFLMPAITFSSDGDLVIGGVDYDYGGGQPSPTFRPRFLLANSSSGEIKRQLALPRALTGEMVETLGDRLGDLGCFPYGLRNHGENSRYFIADFVCQNYSGSGSNAAMAEYYSILDSQNFNLVSETMVSNFDNFTSDDPSRALAIQLDMMRSNDADSTISLATQDVKVISDKISVTKPAKDEKIKPGSYTIKGTATPEQTLTVKVDGTTIGSVTADEYGLWQMKYTFKGTETNVKAVFQTPAYDKIFAGVTQVSPGEDNESVFSSGLVAVNSGKETIEKKLNLPEGILSWDSMVSQDGASLYVLGVDIDLETIKVLKYDTSNYNLASEVDLTDALSEIVAEGQNIFPFSDMLISKDESSLYLSMGSNFAVLSLSDGSLINSYPLGQEYLDAEYEEGSVLFREAVVSEKYKYAQVPYPNGSGFVIIDLETSQIQQVALPEGVGFYKTIVDEDTDMSYMLTQTQVGESPVYNVTAYDIEADDVAWSADLGGYAALMPDMTLSPDGDKIILVSVKLSGESYGLGSIELSADSGIELATDLQLSGDTFNEIARLSSLQSPVVSVKINPSKITGDTYYVVYGSYGAGGLILELNLNDSEVKVVFSTLTDANNDILEIGPQGFMLLFGSMSSSFVVPAPAQDISASRSLDFETTLATTTTPAINSPPPTAGILDPTVSENQPSTSSKVSRVKSTQLGESIEPNKPSKIQSFIANLFAVTKRFVVSVPLPLVNAFPYLLLMLIVGLIAYYLFQTQKELRRQDRLRALYEKQQVLSEEKRNFLELTSHYLRTPLTYIKAGSEMLLRNKQNEQAETELSEAVGHLGLFIESLIEEASSNDQLQEIDTTEQKVWSPLLQKSFWVPVACFAVALSLFYLIFGVIGGVNFGPARYITQILLIFIVVQLFYGMFKNHRNILSEEAQLAKTVNAEATLDHARSKLMHDAGEQLKVRTQHLESAINKLQSSDTSKTIMQQGVDRLSELSQAFVLVSQLENDIMQGKVEDVPVRTLAAEVIEPLAAKFKEKKVKVEISGFDDDIKLNTNKPLAEVTLKTLLENALQATKEGSSLIVKCLHSDGRIAFQVIDHGPGIPKDKIERLFKPFVRVGPVTTFNREGIGLSLYIDRLIMHALGGEIEVVSRFKHGTTATVTFNEKPAA